MSHSGLQAHVAFFGGSDESEVHPFLTKGFLLHHLHEEDSRLQLFLLEFDETIISPLSVLLVALLKLFFIEDEHVELVGRTDEIETYVLLGWSLELECQFLFLLVKEVSEGHCVLEGDEEGIGVNDSDCELCVIECDHFD